MGFGGNRPILLRDMTKGRAQASARTKRGEKSKVKLARRSPMLNLNADRSCSSSIDAVVSGGCVSRNLSSRGQNVKTRKHILPITQRRSDNDIQKVILYTVRAEGLQLRLHQFNNFCERRLKARS